MGLEKLGRKGQIVLVALLCLTVLAAWDKPIGFRDCFDALMMGFFASNYGEHREKAKVNAPAA